MTGNVRRSIFVSTMPFGEHDPAPVEWLAETGWDVRVNDTGRKLKPEEVAEYARDCDGIVAGTEDLSPLLDRNTKLQVISRVGVGLDSVPLKRCRERGIAITYTPDAVTPAVAEFAVGAMLLVCRDIAGVDRKMRKHVWHRSQGLRLGAARIGIIGFGRIGSRVGRLLSGFEPAQVLISDRLGKHAEIAALAARGVRAQPAGNEQILEECDIVTLHVPIDHTTRGFIKEPQLRRMKKGAFLINTSRGGLVDEDALFRVLQDKHLAGAAVDVFEHEPYTGPLCTLENVLVTAHLGSCSVDCRADMEREATADLIRHFKGEPLRSPVPAVEYENQGLLPEAV
jgi:D-3-phosphoglycerate dehydrogenase